METNEFLKQFGGSATANLVTAVCFMLYKFVEGRCKHSKCSSDTSCFKCSADNYNTERASSPRRIKEDDILSEKSVSELQTRKHQEVQERHSPFISVIEPESREYSRNTPVVKRGTIV